MKSTHIGHKIIESWLETILISIVNRVPKIPLVIFGLSYYSNIAANHAACEGLLVSVLYKIRFPLFIAMEMQPEKFSQNSDKEKGWLTEEMCLIPVKDKSFLPPPPSVGPYQLWGSVSLLLNGYRRLLPRCQAAVTKLSLSLHLTPRWSLIRAVPMFSHVASRRA